MIEEWVYVRVVGAGNRVTACDLALFTDDAEELVPPENAHAGWSPVDPGPDLGVHFLARGRSLVHAGYMAGAPRGYTLVRAPGSPGDLDDYYLRLDPGRQIAERRLTAVTRDYPQTAR